MDKLVIDGPGKWVYDFLLRQPSVRVGRSGDNELVLGNPKVSAHHAVIERVPGGSAIRDLGSTNGTFVNRERIQHRTLAHNDLIQIGDFDLTYLGASGARKVADDFLLQGLATVGEGPAPAREAPINRAMLRGLGFDYKSDLAGATGRVRQSMAALPDPDENLHAVLAMILAMVAADNGYIMVVDRPRNAYVVKASAGMEWERCVDRALTFSHTAADTALAQGRAVLSADTMQDSRLRRADSVVGLGIRSVLCVPIRREGIPVGVIYLDNRSTDQTFAEEDQVFLERVAEIVIDRMRESEAASPATPAAAGTERGGAQRTLAGMDLEQRPANAPAAARERVVPPVAPSPPPPAPPAPVRHSATPSAGAAVDASRSLCLGLLASLSRDRALRAMLEQVAAETETPVAIAALCENRCWNVAVLTPQPQQTELLETLLLRLKADLAHRFGMEADLVGANRQVYPSLSSSPAAAEFLELRGGMAVAPRTDYACALYVMGPADRPASRPVAATIHAYTNLLAEALLSPPSAQTAS